jgi:hypothetical protein
MTALQRLRYRPLLLIEALLALAFACLLIAVLPFRSVAKFTSAGAIKAYEPAPAEEARLIARSIEAWAARVPWRAVCFHQGLAALAMLRRRGYSATLYYGAAHSESASLVAHVWVKSANIDVIGCENVSNYGLLATFPDRNN